MTPLAEHREVDSFDVSILNLQHQSQLHFASDLDRIDLLLESPGSAKTAHAPLFNEQRRSVRVLGTLSVASITFFYGCGGPLGSEEVVRIGGPLAGLLALCVYPVVFTIPYAYVVAELSSAFPEDGGFTIWVLNAFGPFWGFQIGYWSWVAGIFGAAIYPGYLLQLLKGYLHSSEISTTLDAVLKVAIGVILSLPTFGSTRLIGRGAVLLLALVFLPLFLYTVWCYAAFKDASDLDIIRRVNGTSAADWRTPDLQRDGPRHGIEDSLYSLINSVFWNYDGIQMASVFGGQVANPARVYSRAIWITVALTVAVYTLPIPATLVSKGAHWTEFTRGAYVHAAATVGGSFLRGVMILSTVCSNVGLFMSSLFCKAFEVAGMADSRLVPLSFAARNRAFGSPHNSLLVTMALTLALSVVEVETLLPVTNTFAALVTLVIFVSAIRLRRSLPYIPRPTRVPGGLVGVVLLSVIPTIVCGYIIAMNITAGVKEAVMIAVFVLPGLCYGGYMSYRLSAEY
ncbi:hypothetical protein ATCC90586_001008 [Pythium insidiosum]|nr:hypothetical protein ATCC90586_001008 [Pythium insidiosum]